MQYLILETFNESLSQATEDMGNDVQDYLNTGWKPQGGISIIRLFEENKFTGYMAFQAITHEGNGSLPA